MYDIKSRRPHTTLGVSGKRFEPFNYHNASNNPPTAIIGVNKAGAVMAGCASPVLILVALATRSNNLAGSARGPVHCHRCRIDSLGDGVLGRSRKNAARVASNPDFERGGARRRLQVVGLGVVAAVCRVGDVVADAAVLRIVMGLEDAGAADRAGVGEDQPVCAHCGLFVVLTGLRNR
jgi:hypothetical protein